MVGTYLQLRLGPFTTLRELSNHLCDLHALVLEVHLIVVGAKGWWVWLRVVEGCEMVQHTASGGGVLAAAALLSVCRRWRAGAGPII